MINTRKIAKITFSATSSESGMPTGQRKLAKLSELLGKLRKSYRKVIGRSSTGLQARQILIVTQFNATNGLPSVKDNERRRQCRFQLSSATTLHIQIKQKHSSANSCCARCARRSAQNVFLRHESLSRIKRKKETLKSFFYSRRHEFATYNARPSTIRRLKLTF